MNFIQIEKNQIDDKIGSLEKQIENLDNQKNLINKEIDKFQIQLSNLRQERRLLPIKEIELKEREYSFFPLFLRKKFVIQGKNVSKFSISPDNKKILINSDKHLFIYDFETEKEIWNHLFETEIFSTCWKDNESFIIEYKFAIYYYNYITNVNFNIKTINEKFIFHLVGIIQDYIVFTINNDNNIYLIHKNTYEEKVLNGHTKKPIQIKSCMDNYILSMSILEVKIWDLNTLTCIHAQLNEFLHDYIFPFHNKEQILYLCLNNLLITNFREKTNQSLNKPININQLFNFDGYITNNNEYFIYRQSKNVYFYNFNKQNNVFVLEGNIRYFQISPDNKFIIFLNNETLSLEVWFFGKDEPKPVRKG